MRHHLQGLLAANEEFAEEVKRLYREEKLWEEEVFKLKAETSDISERLGRELKDIQEDWEEGKRKYKSQEEKLVESVRVLTFDNDRLLQEREKDNLATSKSHVVRSFFIRIKKEIYYQNSCILVGGWHNRQNRVIF